MDHQQELPFNIIEIRIPKACEKTSEVTSQLFAAFASLPKKKFFITGSPPSISFEIACVDQQIHFLIVCQKNMFSYVESQIAAQYPECTMTQLPNDYLSGYPKPSLLHITQLKLASSFCLPLRIYKDLKGADLLSSLLGTMSKAGINDFMAVQVLIAQAGNWQGFLQQTMEKGIPAEEGKTKSHPQAKYIEKKLACPGFWTAIRLVGNSEILLNSLVSSFSVFQSEVNRLKKPKVFFDFQKKKLLRSAVERSFKYVPRNQVLNTDELASIWHLPSSLLSDIKNIAWGRGNMTESPINLPVAENLEEADKQQINFIARTEYKNRIATFGIKKKDRRRHIYILGKSGTGKSTLIANMAINDLRNREGLAVVDPHGDLTEILLDYIPSYRINEVCYLDPSNTQNPFRLNPLEVKNKAHKELVASNIVAIFYKLYSYTWGPRLEYVLRNTILTLLETPEPTLIQVIDMLTNKNFRSNVIAGLTDSVLRSFWVNEFEKMPEKLLNETISPILNKVGQFVTSPTIRQIIGTYHSTIDLEEIMNTGKVLLVNLSQGKIGEDNAALLGAMIITQLQLAAMNRINVPEEERKDFYLYVDEFQNFATSAFTKILSEARKYRLDLTLANQYVGQLDEALQKGIFGNAGTLISFVIGSADATLIASEFGQTFKPEDLVALGMYQIGLKVCIDNLTSMPFLATTLPLPRCKNENREKVLRISLEKHTKKAEPPKPISLPTTPVPPLPPAFTPTKLPTQPFSSQRSFPPRRPFSPRPNYPPQPPLSSNQPNPSSVAFPPRTTQPQSQQPQPQSNQPNNPPVPPQFPQKP